MARKPPPLARAAAVAAGAVLLQALLVLWFAWPAEKTAPRDLPVVVAGPAPAAAAVADRLRTERPGAFEVTTVADAAAADARLRDRAAYAALVVEPSGVSVHVASAASPTVATLFGQAAQELGNGRPVQVVDVVPGPADDPRGAGFTSGFLPLLMTSIACGILLLFVVGSHWIRVAGLLLYAVLAGAVATWIMHALGTLTGDVVVEAGVVGLLALAVSGTVAGLGAALGRPGIGLGVLLVFLLGNPISGLASAPEMLPQPWGAIGQWLPPGAGASLLRSVAFFDGAAASRPLSALLAWAAAGLALTAVGHYRDRARRAAAADPARIAAQRLGATASATS
jgi:hypothetical protein